MKALQVNNLRLPKLNFSSNEASSREIFLVQGILLVALPLFFLSDGVNKVINFHEDWYISTPSIRFSIIIRSVFELIFFALMVVFLNRKRAFFLIGTGTLFFFFLLANYSVSLQNADGIALKENIISFNKYFFVFICFFAIESIKQHEYYFKRVLVILEIIFLANALSAILGFLFEIPHLRTYPLPGIRFGYDGLMPAQNESTLFFLNATAYFFFNTFVKKRYSQSWKLAIVLIACALTGTKGGLMILGGSMVLYFGFYTSIRTKITSMTILLVTSPFIVPFLFQRFMKSETMALFNEITETRGVWSSLLSGRDIYFKERILSTIEHWNIINYLFGGQDQTTHFLEMDFFDLFLFLGIIGGSIYLIMQIKVLFRFNYKYPFTIYYLGVFYFIAFFAGHFFMSAANALYFAIVCLYLQQNFNNKQDESN